jgi:hypothetical protein
MKRNGASCSGHVRDQGTRFNLSSVRKVGKRHTLRPSRNSRFIRLSPSCCEDRAKQPDTLQALRKITGHGWQALSLVLSKTLQVMSSSCLSVSRVTSRNSSTIKVTREGFSFRSPCSLSVDFAFFLRDQGCNGDRFSYKKGPLNLSGPSRNSVHLVQRLTVAAGMALPCIAWNCCQ